MSVDFIDFTALARSRYTDLFKNDEHFDALITSITEVLNDYQREYEELRKTIFNIDLQKGYGLDYIGERVKQKRLLTNFNQGIHFGFEGSYKSGTFGTVTDPEVGAVFYSTLSTNQGSGRVLNDTEYRNVIKARIISNSSKCTPKEFLSIVNLLTFSTQNSIDWSTHGVINLNIIEDRYGLLDYFISRVGTEDNILPIAAGYRVEQNYIDTVDPNWSIQFQNVVNGVANYTGTQGSYKSTASLDLTNKTVQSFSNETLREWQAVKDAANQVTGVTDWFLDTVNNRIVYTKPSDSPTSSDEFAWIWAGCSSYQACTVEGIIGNTPQSACQKWADARPPLTVSSTIPMSELQARCIFSDNTQQDVKRVSNPSYDPNAEQEEHSLPIDVVSQQIIANSMSSSQGTALLAQTYLEEVAKTLVTVEDLSSQLEANKTI